MPRHPVVLVHGYSDHGDSFTAWSRALQERGYDVSETHVCSYRTLTNEVTIPDIAEGFDRALRIRAGLDQDEDFDVIVHSTGSLVVRAWLTTYAKRRERLKHFIGLAPANFGSPLAHKGRSWLGSLFTGNHQVGPDFLEAGDRVLDGLELGSRFTWNLAHTDMLGKETFYGPTASTPFTFTFCGARGFRGITRLISEPGTDGVVRWAGCALNTRKIVFDLTQNREKRDDNQRVNIPQWTHLDSALIPIANADHGAILQKPSGDLIDMVDRALQVDTKAAYEQWHTEVIKSTTVTRQALDEWQQFIVRAIDERGDPINDYNLKFYQVAGPRERELQPFDMDVHVYHDDPSFRCFHVNLTKIKPSTLSNLWLRIIASSGSRFVGYHGYQAETIGDNQDQGKWDAKLDISQLLHEAAEVKFFYPFTTTLVELRLNREPLPPSGKNEICWF